MNPEHVQHLLDALDSDGPWSAADEPARLLRALEGAADERPGDRGLARVVEAVGEQVTAADGLPGQIAGVRLERMVRWDSWSCTWEGIHSASGRLARVRTLRAHSARVPFRRRSLVREGRSLTGVVPDLVVHADSSWPALTVLLPGPPLGSSPEPELSREPDALVRMLGTALGSLARWEEAGLGIDGLSGDEICDGAGGLVIVCLSPSEPGDAGAGIARVARALDSWWDEGGESPVDDLLGGLATFPPRSAREAVDRWSHALADHLVGLHHALARRHRGLVHEERASRLAVQVERLVRAVAPPQGRGAVGVDLEGRTLVVEGRAQALCWGPAGTPLAAVCEPRGRLDARQARRLLRARATAPLKPHLQEAVGGQAAFVEAACRWVAARLSLRTVRLLLEATR